MVRDFALSQPEFHAAPGVSQTGAFGSTTQFPAVSGANASPYVSEFVGDAFWHGVEHVLEDAGAFVEVGKLVVDVVEVGHPVDFEVASVGHDAVVVEFAGDRVGEVAHVADASPRPAVALHFAE